jgi:hypothetical protein
MRGDVYLLYRSARLAKKRQSPAGLNRALFRAGPPPINASRQPRSCCYVGTQAPIPNRPLACRPSLSTIRNVRLPPSQVSGSIHRARRVSMLLSAKHKGPIVSVDCVVLSCSDTSMDGLADHREIRHEEELGKQKPTAVGCWATSGWASFLRDSGLRRHFRW